jgi:hypothetical protein
MALFCFGCTEQESEAQKKVRYFKNNQAPAIMMGGKIKMETVKARDDGKIEFETENNTRYCVEMNRDPDGNTYKYDKLKELK